MALWSNKTVQVPGLASTYASSGPITAESRRHYILDTTSNAITVNLPTGIDGQTIRISDAKATFQTNKVTVVPATGQKINNLATNESLLLDVNEMWIEFTWNALAGSWIVNAPGVLGLIANTYTDYPYITSPVSPASSTLRLYAKSDGKLYVKDSSGTEKKVGGGLDHPTTGSTFEVDSYNISMTGQYNTGIGVSAGTSITSGTENVVFGLSAGQNITSGGSNTLIGSSSGIYISTNGANTAVGRNTFRMYGTISTSVAIGSGTGYYAQGSGHTLVGPGADSYTDSGSYNNTAIGKDTGVKTSLTGVNGTVCIGADASGNSATATISNQFVLGTSNHLYNFPGVAQTSLVLGPTGTSTGQTGTLSFRELAANGTNVVTLKAPDAITSDVTLTLPSSAGTNGQALTTNGSGVLSWSTLIGLSHPTTESTFETATANASMSGTGNTAIGYGAGVSLTSGGYNAFYGTWAGANIIAGSQNTALGYNALGQGNHSSTVAIGYSAINSVNGGSQNVIIGTFAGYNLSGACSYNTIINSRALASAGTFNGIVAIGMDSSAGWATATGSNQFVLGTSNHLYRFPGVAQTSLVLGPTGTSTGQTGTLSFRELAANGTNAVTLRAADNIAADVTFTLPSADGTSGQFLTTNGSGVLSWGTVNTSNSTITVTQNSHGFVAADIGRPVYLNGSTYTLAKADLETTAEVAGLINSIIDTNNFTLCLAGEVSSVGANLLDTAIITKIAAASDHNAVFVSGTTIYVGLGSGLAISTNGGTTWTIKTTSDGLAGNGVQGIFVSGTNIYVATGNGLSISTNGGTTWTTTFSGSNVKGVFVSGSTIYAARMGGAGLSISTDGGSTWVTRTTSNGLGSSWVEAVYAVGSTVYAATDGGLSISTDGGSTFVNKTTTNGLGSNVALAVYVTGTTVYVGTNAGVSISTDGGSTFVNKTTANGLGSNVIRGVTASGSMVYAATDGGLSISNDGGSSFVNKTTTDGLATIYATSVSIFNNIVYATTGGGGGGLSSFVASALPTSSALVTGTMYFLSAFIAGKITATPPSVVGQISKPIGIARSTTAIDFYNMRGSAVGGTNVYTQIGLSNNATTTIQNVSAYDSVELQGWIYLNATAKYRYLFKAQVTKKGDGTDYLVSFQNSGDTPPDGFNITVTTAGLVQVTLPSITGFSSAVAQFSLNGPAVGASLPLQINSGLITPDGSAESPRGWTLSTNADYTFSASTSSRVRVTATSANRSVNLPSTGIKTGYEAEIITSCSGGYTIAIKSSNGNTIDTLKGSKGKIRLVALQDTPTTSAHWELVDVYDRGTWTPSVSSGGFSVSSINRAAWTRINNLVSVITDFALSGTGDSNPLQISGLPFTADTGGWSSTVCYFAIINTANRNLAGVISAGSSIIQFQINPTGTDRVAIGSDFGVGYLNINGNYIIA